MRYLKSILLLVVVLALGVGALQAQDAENVPTIADGRVNSWDLAAPVAVYCHFSYPYADDVNMGVFDNLELWGLTGDQFELVATVTAAEIKAAGSAPSAPTLLTTARGYSLYREPDGSFTVTAAPDAEGKVYSFNWSFGAQNC